MAVKNVLWFNEIFKNDVPIVGGKGANLGEMVNAKFPVPPGFVVTAQAYFDFLRETGLKREILKKLENIDVENTAVLENISQQIRQIIQNAKMAEELKIEIKKNYAKIGEREIAWLSSSEEEFVAVRSSATAEDLPEASFAGQQETYLNVRGKEKVVEAVKNCWSSLFTPRAIYYRQKQGFSTEKVGIAVVVQKMVNSDQSGIMFTTDPTGNRNKIIIEAGFGLGETIVSGSVTPDHYEVDKKTLEIVSKKIQKQEWKLVRDKAENKRVELKEDGSWQKIPEDKILELAEIGKKIEEHYGMPQDIEWAIENKKLYIVQSRAITTLGLQKKVEAEKEEEKNIEQSGAKVLLKGLGASPGIVFGKVIVVPEIENVSKLKGGEILVTKMTSPDWVPIMKKSIAIITNEGGTVCHAAIVSRELQIPCIVGTSNGTNVFKDGQIVTVNGYNGEIYEGEVKFSIPEQQKFEKEWIIKKEEIDEMEKALKEEIIEEEKEEKIETVEAEKMEKAIDEFEEISVEKMEEEDVLTEEELLVSFLRKISPKVKVNVALPEAAENAAKTGADGIGLLRAEHMITSSGIHPAQYLREGKDEELKNVVKEGIRKVVQFFKDKPVWYRTFDARTDEFMHLKGGELEPKESNPMIGWHGIRRDLDETNLLKAQLLAIKELHDEGFTKIGVMLPFVQNSEEVKKAKELAKEWGIEFGKGEGKIIFGIMVETPAAVWTIDEMIKEGINFVSFGTNDLTQLTLGIDRNNEHIQKWFNENQPQILRQLEYVISKCGPSGVETSICGQAASNPEMVKKLVRFGINSVSANIDAVEKIRQTVLIETKKMILEKNSPA